MLLNSKEINVKTCVIPLPNKVGGFTYVNATDFTTFVSPYKNPKYMGFGCANNINRNINILNNLLVLWGSKLILPYEFIFLPFFNIIAYFSLFLKYSCLICWGFILNGL